jgi:hypothetical protein
MMSRLSGGEQTMAVTEVQRRWWIGFGCGRCGISHGKGGRHDRSSASSIDIDHEFGSISA